MTSKYSGPLFSASNRQFASGPSRFMRTGVTGLTTAVCIALTAPSVFGQVAPAKIISAPAGPIGIAASPTQLLYSEPFCQVLPGTRTIKSVNPATSAVTPFITLPDEIVATPFPSTPESNDYCAENYFAISKGAGSFLGTAGDVYVFAVVGAGTDPGANALPATPPGQYEILHYPASGGSAYSVFATLPSSFGNHVGVTFDTTGTFQNALIVTGEQGVVGYNASGTVLFSYPNPTLGNPVPLILENATVAPITYAPCPGCLFIAAQNPTLGGPGAIFTVPPGAPSGTVPIVTAAAPTELEALSFVTPQMCSLGGFSYFVSGFHTPNSPPVATSSDGAILAYTDAQVASHAGQFLAPEELSGLVYAYTTPASSSVFSITGYQLEGGTTVPCPSARGCTLTQGGYKNHFNSKLLPLTLGSVSYTTSQINAILQNNTVAGNGLISLAHQLITAKLNIIYGAAPDAATQLAINQADALIGSLVIPPVGTGSLSPSATSSLENTLDAFNNRGPECQ